MDIKTKVEKLRKLMKEKKIDAYIIPSFDAHQSEYVSDHFKCREWISGFTGSAGTVVVTLEGAGLWTDGRYYIQAKKQLKGSGIELFKAGNSQCTSYVNWLKTTLKKKACIGFYGEVFSVELVKNIKKSLKKCNMRYRTDLDLINRLWKNRPKVPSTEISIQHIKYVGKSSIEKLNEVRIEMKNKGANYYLLNSLDDIAWLLNIRGKDIPSTPVTIANVLVGEDNCFLFIDDKKVTDEVRRELKESGIELKAYEVVGKFLSTLTSKDTVIYDSSKININLYKAINVATKKIKQVNITTNLKAIKNEVEIENLKHCEVLDGVAMVKFVKWLKASVEKGNITEISAAEKIDEFRKNIELFTEVSFDTISGYKDHGAIVHYSATKETDYTLKKEGLLLVDSGGQYLNGTTDITRTIVLGKLTEEEKKDFTLVLKAHINLGMAKFLYGSTGSNLDVLARKPLWDCGKDYKHGTGHGVGFFLNVHEGPQSFNQVNTVKLEKGMVITNEPGLYREGKYGIRTENILVVTEDEKTEFGDFMKFDTISYCPIDLEGIDKELLNEKEKNWLNSYHREVYTKLSSYLNEEERIWLQTQTEEI